MSAQSAYVSIKWPYQTPWIGVTQRKGGVYLCSDSRCKTRVTQMRSITLRAIDLYTHSYTSHRPFDPPTSDYDGVCVFFLLQVPLQTECLLCVPCHATWSSFCKLRSNAKLWRAFKWGAPCVVLEHHQRVWKKRKASTLHQPPKLFEVKLTFKVNFTGGSLFLEASLNPSLSRALMENNTRACCYFTTKITVFLVQAS